MRSTQARLKEKNCKITKFFIHLGFFLMRFFIKISYIFYKYSQVLLLVLFTCKKKRPCLWTVGPSDPVKFPLGLEIITGCRRRNSQWMASWLESPIRKKSESGRIYKVVNLVEFQFPWRYIMSSLEYNLFIVQFWCSCNKQQQILLFFFCIISD